MLGAVDGKEMLMVPGMYSALETNAAHRSRCADACLMYIGCDTPYGLHFP
jgi:hypothetical protein